MDYMNIRNESECLDQVLMIIFVVLVIFFIVFFFNVKNNESMEQSDSDIEDIKKKYKELVISCSEEKVSKTDTDIDEFLRRIKNKYSNETFENLNENVVIENVVGDNFVNNVVVNKNEVIIDDVVKNNSQNISGFLNGDQACNMDQQQRELVDDYKKKYFRMYRHQIECPKNCQLPNVNLSKCDLADDNRCEGIFTKDYNNPDVFTLSHLALDKNNNRKCVTCTSNDDRQTADMMILDLNVNEEEEVKINERRLNNRNKFADFNNYIERNGVMETSVDKIAELRTCTTGTCGLNSYGKKVSDVYNNLLSTSYTEDKNKCVNGPVEGVNDSNSNDTYAMLNQNY